MPQASADSAGVASGEWTGDVRMHTTRCDVAMSIRPLDPQTGLYHWAALATECEVGVDPATEAGGRRLSLLALETGSAPESLSHDPQVGGAVGEALGLSGGSALAAAQRRLGEEDAEENPRPYYMNRSFENSIPFEVCANSSNEVFNVTWTNETNLRLGCLPDFSPPVNCSISYNGSLWDPYDPAQAHFVEFFRSDCPGLLREPRILEPHPLQARDCAPLLRWNTTAVCVCPRGYQGDARSYCEDILECETGVHNCDEHATCTNTVGSFTCACNIGWRGSGVECVDIDECAEASDNCHRWLPLPFGQSKCTNTAGSFECACNQGFLGNGVFCQSMSEISWERVWSPSTVLQVVFSWRNLAPLDARDAIIIRKMPEGRQLAWFYTSAGSEDAPCGVPQSCAQNVQGKCENPCHRTGEPRYFADLTVRLQSAGPGEYVAALYAAAIGEVVAKATINIVIWDYTQEEPDFQGTVALTSIQPDSLYLSFGGLTGCALDLDNPVCGFVESDEFEYLPKASSGESDEFLRCGDGRWSPQKNETCDDGNSVSGDGCDSGCRVQTGWQCDYASVPDMLFDNATNQYHTWNPETGEALLGDHTCWLMPACGDGVKNRVEDDCDDGNTADGDGCSSQCLIEPGWHCYHEGESPASCVGSLWRAEHDFNATLCPTCHEQGFCGMWEGEVYCFCKVGWDKMQQMELKISKREIDGGSVHMCEDGNECDGDVELHGCADSGQCVNTPGSFFCTCPAGMIGTGLARDETPCSNLDECTELDTSSTTGFLHRCHPVATCSDTAGSYTCTCAAGYAGDGEGDSGCVDRNECEFGGGGCDENARCLNEPGSYRCECLDGFVGTGQLCIPSSFYQANRDLWELLGQDGRGAAAEGLVRVSPEMLEPPNPGDSALFVAWAFAGAAPALMHPVRPHARPQLCVLGC